MPHINNLTFEESTQRLNLQIIKDNNSILDAAYINIEESSLLSSNPDIGGLYNCVEEIFYIEPDFLRNPSNSRIKFARREIMEKKKRI